MTQEPQATDDHAFQTGARRVWFPWVWPLLLAGICTAAWFAWEDRGKVNSLVHASIILLTLGWIVWLFLRSGFSVFKRWSITLVLLVLVAGYYLQWLPIETINNGDVGVVGWRWRWSRPDQQLSLPETQAAAALDWQTSSLDYPKFLGNGYWAEAHGVALDQDWETNRPKELWRRRIGAGWSSFAVVGNYAVTQEQRDEQELVTCTDIHTGEIVWTHADNVRFDPSGGGSLGGIGPRATPTIHDGKIYVHGATGILNCLDAATGDLVWSHDTLQDFKVNNLLWGKSTSPLVVGDGVIVSVGDSHANIKPESEGLGNSLVAYDRHNGDVVWTAGDRRSSYATPVSATIAGVPLIVVVNEEFVTAHDADNGKILWEHPWPGISDANASNSQPVPIGQNRLFLSKGYGGGAELLEIGQDDGKWEIDHVWKRPVMKTKMCNVAIRDGFVYGLDEVNLQCIELATGDSMWKKRRRPSFGHGQILLVGTHLLILTEEGEVVLAAVDSEKYRELGSFQALEGVTWNNPTLVGSRLLVRNAEWAACFELPLLTEGPLAVDLPRSHGEHGDR